MSQLSLYLDDATMSFLRANALQEGLSLSRYVKKRIEQNAFSMWPSSFWETYGALEDDSFTVPDEIDPRLDAPRASFDD